MVPTKEVNEAFASHVVTGVIDSWKSASKVHPVDQTEMYAECVARQLWRSDLDALIKGYSKEETMKALVVVLEQLDTNDPCLPWYCRVPSPYNVADLQSRGKWKELFTLFPECMRSFCILPFSVPETFRGSNRQKKKKCIAEEKWGTRKKACKAKCFIFLE